MRPGFATFMLNEEGKAKAARIGAAFDALLDALEATSGGGPDFRGGGERELALVRTKLEEACFYAKKSVAIQPRHQNNGPVAP